MSLALCDLCGSLWSDSRGHPKLLVPELQFTMSSAAMALSLLGLSRDLDRQQKAAAIGRYWRALSKIALWMSNELQRPEVRTNVTCRTRAMCAGAATSLYSFVASAPYVLVGHPRSFSLLLMSSTSLIALAHLLLTRSASGSRSPLLPGFVGRCIGACAAALLASFLHSFAPPSLRVSGHVKHLVPVPAQGTLRNDLFHQLPSSANRLVVLGSRQAGKTFSVSAEAEKRKNCLFVSVRNVEGEEYNSDKILGLAYDQMNKKVVNGWIPPWINPSDEGKAAVMLRLLRRSGTPGNEATLVFDVHSDSDEIPRTFTQSLRVLNTGKTSTRVILAANESCFTEANDLRWDIVKLWEIPRGVSQQYVERVAKSPEKQKILLDSLPLLPGILTADSSRMQREAKGAIIDFLKAFSIACADADRKKFAEEALKGFIDPTDTALAGAFVGSASDKDNAHKWFRRHFVDTNVMACHWRKYNFQFGVHRRLAEKLVANEGNVGKLKAQLNDEGWLDVEKIRLVCRSSDR